MTENPNPTVRVAIACGGTGGHLFPGMAVGHELKRRNCSVTLLVSPKEVDQTAIRELAGMDVVTLPAVGLSNGHLLGFLRGFARSYFVARRNFMACRPNAVLAMGGFTSAPPVLAAKRMGAQTFLHESNTIPGRANRWLSWGVSQAFVGFPGTASRLHTRHVHMTGTPVRPQFKVRDPGHCRWALGLDPERPVLLVMGGSQGASGINRLVIQTLASLPQSEPGLQYVHLTGTGDFEAVNAAYASHGIAASVHAFFRDMEIAMGAATVAISRAGASSLAELAAMRVPSILIPFPAATDNHQLHNGRALQESGAAFLLPQKQADPETLSRLVLDLVRNPGTRVAMQRALDAWHRPDAAVQIARGMLESLNTRPGPNLLIESESSLGPAPAGPETGEPPPSQPLSNLNARQPVQHRQEVAA